MNYLFLVPSLAFGGLEMQMVDKAVEARKRGDKAVVALSKGSRSNDYADKYNLDVVFFKISIDYFDLSASFKLAKIFERLKIDVCVVGVSKHLSIAIWAKKLSRSKTKVIFFQHMQSGLNKRDFFHNFIYKNLDGAVVLTELMWKQMNEGTLINPDKIAIVAHGVDLEKFNPEKFSKAACKRKLGVPENSFLIGYASRIDEQKDQMTLLKAFSLINDENFYLIFAGGTDKNFEWYRKSLEEFIKSNDLESRVKILPFIEEISSFMNALDLFVIPSRSETFGLVIIEAMAAGLPVIGVNSGGVPEIIVKNENGFLIEQRDFEYLSNYIKIIAENENLREKFSNNSQKFAILKYKYEVQTKKFFDFCEKINNI